MVFDTIGDSANLLISQLVPGDNRIICLQNGFLALDRLFYMGDTTCVLDQLEAHQIARSFPRLYGAVINFNFVPMYAVAPNFRPIAAYMALVRGIQHALGRLFTPHNFHVPFADTRRVIAAARAHVPNGIIAIFAGRRRATTYAQALTRAWSWRSSATRRGRCSTATTSSTRMTWSVRPPWSRRPRRLPRSGD